MIIKQASGTKEKQQNLESEITVFTACNLKFEV